MKILLAIDGSPCSDSAVEEVARRPWPERSSLKVLTVLPPPLPPSPRAWALPPSYYEEREAAIRKRGQEIVDSALQKLKSNKALTISSALEPGEPRPVIIDAAKSWGAELIVLGSHGYSAWKQLLLGSVSQAVVSHAKCSVEVVRRPAVNEKVEDEPSKKGE